jgi:hypothetical protein
MEPIKKPPSMECKEPTMPRSAKHFFEQYAANLLYGYFATNPKANRKSISSLTDLPEDKRDILNWTLENSTEHQKAILHDEWTRTKASDSVTQKRCAQFCFPNIQLKTFSSNSWSLLPEPALKVFRYICFVDCAWLDVQRLAAEAHPPLGPPQSVYVNQWTRWDDAGDPSLGPPQPEYVNQWVLGNNVELRSINFLVNSGVEHPVHGLLKRSS